MSIFNLFRRQDSAPVARDRLQILLAHERAAVSGKSAGSRPARTKGLTMARKPVGQQPGLLTRLAAAIFP